LGKIGLPAMPEAFFENKRFYFRYTDKFSELCSKTKKL
jgi:hypothetical protein